MALTSLGALLTTSTVAVVNKRKNREFAESLRVKRADHSLSEVEIADLKNTH